MTKTQPTWPDEVEKRLGAMVSLRRDFHRHPELSFRSVARARSSRIASTPPASTCARGWPRRASSACCDATARAPPWPGARTSTPAPLTETLDAPFASGTPGVMHACAHDGHTAIALTLADILAARRREMPGTAVFLFQPAEEILGGARPMIEAGVLDDPRVREGDSPPLTTTAPGGLGAAGP